MSRNRRRARGTRSGRRHLRPPDSGGVHGPGRHLHHPGQGRPRSGGAIGEGGARVVHARGPELGPVVAQRGRGRRGRWSRRGRGSAGTAESLPAGRAHTAASCPSSRASRCHRAPPGRSRPPRPPCGARSAGPARRSPGPATDGWPRKISRCSPPGRRPLPARYRLLAPRRPSTDQVSMMRASRSPGTACPASRAPAHLAHLARLARRAYPRAAPSMITRFPNSRLCSQPLAKLQRPVTR